MEIGSPVGPDRGVSPRRDVLFLQSLAAELAFDTEPNNGESSVSGPRYPAALVTLFLHSMNSF
jgi:hypothetical protein